MKVKKKNGLIEDFNVSKINTAISKSAERAMVKITQEQFFDICNHINSKLKEMGYTEESTVPVAVMHMVTEGALDKVLPPVAVSYREFRNYKINLVHLMDKVYKKTNAIRYIGEDVSNANTDSTMASTQRSLIYGYFNKELYMMFFLTPLERQIIEKGYLYIHDAKDRLDTINCCIFRMHDVLKGGFEMGNIWYNEPKSVDTAFDVISDVALSAASQQYGGFTIPRTDDLLEPYAKKTLDFYKNEFMKLYEAIGNPSLTPEEVEQKCDEYSYKKLERDLEQGFQGWEIKFNTVGSSRGDYPFIAISFGLNKSKLGKLINKVCLRVRKNGQGKKGFEKPVLFPKLTFLYDEELHGEGKELEDVFDDAVECSAKCMYPDFLSLTGEGYIPSMYKKYGKVVSLMGCRASLSPWYERGGIHPADEDDVPVFEGRFNLGVISLHLPMILQQSRVEGKDFYELLDYYLEIARNIHKRTFDYMGKKRASTNPLGFMQGGFLGGNLGPNDCIAPLLKPMTLSYGITALNELQQLYNQKSLVEDGEFALEVMHHINDYVDKIKEEDGLLYALYGTPSESLCGTQVEQFVKEYGVIKNVSDRPYVSNSFHCHVTEDITPIQKQDLESRFWDLFNGGKIQYCRYPVSYNRTAIKTLIRRAMKLGFYEGVNLQLCYCEDCGHEELEMTVCPKCGSDKLTIIDRMNGYLGYTKVKGRTRFNPAKNAEIKDRVSM